MPRGDGWQYVLLQPFHSFPAEKKSFGYCVFSHEGEATISSLCLSLTERSNHPVLSGSIVPPPRIGGGEDMDGAHIPIPALDPSCAVLHREPRRRSSTLGGGVQPRDARGSRLDGLHPCWCQVDVGADSPCAWWMTSPLGTPRGRYDEYSSEFSLS
jgi:hypothetical protein